MTSAALIWSKVKWGELSENGPFARKSLKSLCVIGGEFALVTERKVIVGLLVISVIALQGLLKGETKEGSIG